MEMNSVYVTVITEKGCDPEQGGYRLLLNSFIHPLYIDIGRDDDISLITECIENNLDFSKLPEEGVTLIKLKEVGEYEDVVWIPQFSIEEIILEDSIETNVRLGEKIYGEKVKKEDLSKVKLLGNKERK